ncbi:MAG TPA: hypothetical protein VIA45_14625 [Thermoanaerobaculia bacterium]|jgi:hypothetical protein
MPGRVGDAVRIFSTPETERARLAGLVGRVRGETKPSVSGVAVIGSAADDFALEVFFEERQESRWFALDLLQFVRQESGEKEGALKGTGKWEERDLPRSFWRRLRTRLRSRA